MKYSELGLNFNELVTDARSMFRQISTSYGLNYIISNLDPKKSSEITWDIREIENRLGKILNMNLGEELLAKSRRDMEKRNYEQNRI